MGQRDVTERWDRAFRCLAAEPRREIVIELANTPDGVGIRLPEAAIAPRTVVDRDHLRTELYHTHLPLLADNDYIEWTREPFVATRGPAFAEITAILQTVFDSGDELPPSLVEGCGRFEETTSDG